MSSKAFYKSNIKPKLINCFENAATNNARNSLQQQRPQQHQNRSIEVWVTTCIVTNFGKTYPNDSDCSILINPCNPSLTGVKNFPYFPRGGPVPKEKPKSMHKDWQPLGYVSTWGGMEVGTGMMYPVSVIDGIVHQLGGWKLESECTVLRTISSAGAASNVVSSDATPLIDITGRRSGNFSTTSTKTTTTTATTSLLTNSTEPCPIGSAVRTICGCNELLEQYDTIVHTTPPFYNHDADPTEMLKECYRNSFSLAFHNTNNNNHSSNRPVRVAVPLLGSGARGFPYDIAIDVAATVVAEWLGGAEHLTTKPSTTSHYNKFTTAIPTTSSVLSNISLFNYTNRSTGSSTTSSKFTGGNHQQSIVFGVLEESIATQLCDAIGSKINQHG